MRRKLLGLLVLLLQGVAVQMYAQTPTSWIVENQLGTWAGFESRTVYMIAGGAAGYCKDYDGNAMTLPGGEKGVGYMKFVIPDPSKKEAVVYSRSQEKYTLANDTQWGISNKDFEGELIIPSQVKLGSGDGDWYDVTEIQGYAFSSIYGITAVTIEVKNLNKIGDGAFSENTSLQNVSIKSDTQFTIGKKTFRDDVNFNTLTYTTDDETTTNWLPKKVTAVGDSAFLNTGFTEITIPKLKMIPNGDREIIKTETTDVERNTVTYPTSEDGDVYNTNSPFGDKVFSKCKNLETVHIDNTATGVGTFRECEKLKNVTLGENVLFIEEKCFADCEALHHLRIPENVQVLAKWFVHNDYVRVTFDHKEPPFAMKYAFDMGDYGKVYVVVPTGLVSTYLFSYEDKGFQNIENDMIACEYKLSDGNKWGTLSMPGYYGGRFVAQTYDAESGIVGDEFIDDEEGFSKLATYTVNNSFKGFFWDVYDLRRIGVSNDGIATNDGITDEEEARLQQERDELQNKYENLETSLQTNYPTESTNQKVIEVISEVDAEPQSYDPVAVSAYLKELGFSDEFVSAMREFLTAYVEWKMFSRNARDASRRTYADVNVYTADYFYEGTGLVGIDKIQKGAIVPFKDYYQENGEDSYPKSIGYLFEGKNPGGTYYLHHYVGDLTKEDNYDLNAVKVSHFNYEYNMDGYYKLLNDARGIFNSEDIPMPGKLRPDANTKTYSRTKSPNLLVGWDRDIDPSYAQGATFQVDDGTYFGTVACNYYGYDPATDKFRKLSSATWAKFKDGMAFLVVPKSLLSSSNQTLGKFVVNSDDNDGATTGIKIIPTTTTEMGYGPAADRWYTLQGVRLNGKPTVKGIYIHNGRKEAIQ